MDAESESAQQQRKIELQSHQDLAYLLANVRSAAAARLDEAFPHVEGQQNHRRRASDDADNELRSQIEKLVNEYINRTFSLAAPNLSINGLPVGPDAIDDVDSEANTAYEPFDARKRQRVADLIAQEERLLEEVASLKRAVPARAASEHAALLREGLRRDEELLEARVASSEHADAARLNGVGPLERQAGVEDEFRRAVDALGRLKKDMPAVVAKMERARVAGEYVVTDGR